MNTPALRRYFLPLALGLMACAALIGVASVVTAQTPVDQTPTPADLTPGATELIPTSTEGAPVETLTEEEATAAALATPTGEPTPGADVTTVVRLVVPTTIEQPIPDGDEFEVQVLVDDVEHLAGFDFTISFDPDRIEASTVSSEEAPTAQEGTPTGGGQNTVKTAGLGEFLTSGDRSDILCSDARVSGSAALVTCSLLGPPVCAGGAPGVSGSGRLGSVFFKSKGGGLTTLELTRSDLVLDDIAPPCDLTEEGDIQVIPIPHRTEDVEVELAEDSGSNTMLFVIIAVVAVAVVAIGGGGAYLFYRQRQAAT